MNELAPPPAAADPWWRHPMLWMVLGLPAIVVVASFVTLYLALRTPDPVVPQSDNPRALGSSGERAGKGLLPAIAGRNHAATPAEYAPGAKQ
ncbi:hypothetical protein GCM10023165_45950 [Variovorax defluvii]|uniref:Nitrogen fixation protein FixH n=1 Tax=Variovorax defluvii TaxID=913761 RepID=A0ABP8IA43_9BURK